MARRDLPRGELYAASIVAPYWMSAESREPEQHGADVSRCCPSDLLEFALAAADAVAWQWDPDTDEVIQSPNAPRLLGVAPDRLPRTLSGFFALIHPDDRARVTAALRRAAAEGTNYNEEFRLIRPDGSFIWVADRGRALPGRNGGTWRMGGVSVDISERRRAQEALRTSEERFHAFMANSPAIAWIVDSKGRFVYASPPFIHLILVGDGDLTGKSIYDVFPEEMAREYDRNNRLVAEESCVVEAVEAGMRSDGSMGYFLSYKFPIRDASGEVLIGGVAVDITDRKRAEEVQRENDRRKDEFLAILAHELRNPLAPIQSAMHIVGLSLPDDSRCARACTIVQRQVQQLTRLIDDLLDVSRITRGKLELRKERVELAKVIDCALETSRPQLAACGHQLRAALPAQPVLLDADPTRLAQVLANLLNNAAKYTRSGGVVELAVELDGASVLVHVRDNGIGIPPGMLDSIFDMFVQVDDTSQGSPRSGLGIGLTLVKRLVEMHGGQVTAASAGPGTGSRFTVRLPLAVQPQAAVQTLAAADPSRPCCVLVADDNRDAADTLAMLLTMLGNEVHVAYDGVQAVREAEEHPPMVAFLDIGMPGIDGYEVARRLRQQPDTRRAFLVAVTGWGQESDRQRSREAGFDRHIVKPLELPELERVLAAASP